MEDFAEHFGCVTIPAKSGKPKDKALVKNHVKLTYLNVYAPLRNRLFPLQMIFNLSQLLSGIDSNPSQPKSGNDKVNEHPHLCKYCITERVCETGGLAVGTKVKSVNLPVRSAHKASRSASQRERRYRMSCRA